MSGDDPPDAADPALQISGPLRVRQSTSTERRAVQRDVDPTGAWDFSQAVQVIRPANRCARTHRRRRFERPAVGGVIPSARVPFHGRNTAPAATSGYYPANRVHVHTAHSMSTPSTPPVPPTPDPNPPLEWSASSAGAIGRSIEQPVGTVRIADGSYQCFRCRYDLTEMGDAGRCSECGQRFDKDLNTRFTLAQRLTMAPFRVWEAFQAFRLVVNDLPRAAVQEREWWSEKLLPTSRTVVIFLLVAGNASIVVTFAVLALRALMGRFFSW